MVSTISQLRCITRHQAAKLLAMSDSVLGCLLPAYETGANIDKAFLYLLGNQETAEDMSVIMTNRERWARILASTTIPNSVQEILKEEGFYVI
jgi:hypothetical protein